SQVARSLLCLPKKYFDDAARLHDLTPIPSMLILATWRKPTRYLRAPVISSLEEEATTLLVPASEWASYAEATQRGPQPDRVILVEDVPSPSDARYAVDA